MSDTKQLISLLDEKVNELVSKLNQETTILSERNKEIESLTKDLAFQKTEVEKLKAEIEALKSSRLETSPDKEDVRIKIDGLVNEIDKCISLLKV